MVLVVIRKEGWTKFTVAKYIQGRVENDSRKLRDLLKIGYSYSLKKGRLTLSEGMLKKRNVDNDADADEVSHITGWQQH
jgi:hypothetical protein